MKILIETPKYSFFKYNKTKNGYKKVFFSPLPTLFNYGFIEGTKGPDGMEEDVVVLGPRLSQGTVLERDHFDGVVKFLDASCRDDKKLVYLSGFRAPILLSIYFRIYALFKIFLYLFYKRKLTKCSFEGLVLEKKG